MMPTSKLLLLPLAMALSASARLQVDQATSDNYGNHTLAFHLKNDKVPSPPSSPLQSPHTRFTRYDSTKVTSSQLIGRGAKLPSGWRGFCVEDSSGHVLSAYSISSKSMTPASCINTCSSLRYSYAGLENSTECHCDNSFLNGSPTTVPSGECSTPRSDDSSQTCDAGYRLLWYSNTVNGSDQTSTTPNTMVATPTTIPSGWTRTNCVQDGVARFLSGYPTSSDTVTPQRCISACAAQGYTMAGVGHGVECYCDTSYTVATASPSDCSIACDGDHSQQCGGSYRMWVDEHAPAAASWADGGYLMEDPGHRTYPGAPPQWAHTYGSTGDTLEEVRDRSRCNRGNEVDELDTGGNIIPRPGSSADCITLCSDRGSSVCGGGYQLEAIGEGDRQATLDLGPTSGATTGSTSTSTTSTAWTTGPCMIDQASPRLLSNQLSSLTSNTPASCQSQCAANGYRIAGVQYDRECWCGNALSVGGEQTLAGQVVSDSDCTMACSDGGETACGNLWRMRVYGLGSILNQYNLGGFTSATNAAPLNNTIFSRSEGLASSSTTTPSSAATTGSSSTALPAKRVIAHHMVGNTSPYTLDTWSTDISLALGAGIDGFALNVGSGGVGSWQRKQVTNAYDAAAALSASGHTFGLFLSLDMTALGCANQNDAAIVRDYISTFGVHSAQLVLPPSADSALGRVLVSTFSGEDCQFGMGNANDGWKSVLQDATVVAKLHAMGREVAFVPGWFTRVEQRRSEFAGTVQGDYNWNGGWPMGNYDVNWDSDAYHLNYNPGPLFMAGVSPWFFTHYGPDSWNKNWIYRGDDWLYNARWEMLINQRSHVDIAQIITWNDYGESSYIGPIEGDQPNSQAWTNSFPHDGWLKMTRYYANAFKSGTYPAITEDNVYIWSRPHPKDAWAMDYVGRPHNAEWTDDYLWAVVFSTKPAKLTLTSGPNSGQFSVISGVNKFKIPNGYGGIRATLADAVTGLVSVDVNAGSAFTYTSQPSSYNFNAFVAWG